MGKYLGAMYPYLADDPVHNRNGYLFDEMNGYGAFFFY